VSPQVLAIIVNYRTPDLTIRATEALILALEALPGSQIVIVDNNSNDGSLDALRSALSNRPLPQGIRMTITSSPRNGGFGYGVNFALRPALDAPTPPDYIYLLNSDAFPRKDAVTELVHLLETHPDAGIAGSFVHGVDGRPHETAFRFPTLLGEVEGGLKLGLATKALKRWTVPMTIPKAAEPVDWVAGASMLLKRSVFERVGLFDETFFLYFEETDLCLRARRQGLLTYYVPTSVVAHVGSASTGMQDKTRRLPAYWFASRSHYFRKNFGRAYLHATNAAWLASSTLFQARRRIQGKPDDTPPHQLTDFLRYSFLGGLPPR
jgi:N-acetylglucosaminyl-diphospho-decaprenol L-rhamnosyltransferase